MTPDAVLKIGGSLGRGGGLQRICGEIGRLGKNFRLMVVPGGGQFADEVRAAYKRYALDETTAHRMALLAMDQFGYVLGDCIPNSYVTANFESARNAAAVRRPAVLLPSALVIESDPLPHSWQVTSDTIAAWIAHLGCSRRLILLKDVDGLMTETPGSAAAELLAELSPEELARHSGGVDDYLGRFLSAVCLETWVVNGLFPERLSELLENSHTVGTRIRTR
jgi:5-(aminomethyl)-3-furanmethanol phosphate kinase